MNPYWGTTFIEFCQVFFSRLGGAFSSSLATDEIQVGVLSCVAIACGLVGPFLVLKKMTMFANSLSHTILLGIVGAFLCFGGAVIFDFSHLLLGACLAAVLTVFLTEGLVKWFEITEDASIGLSFTFLFALGIVLSNLFLRDLHLGSESVMGNTDALLKKDLLFSFFLLLLNAFVVCLFYRQFKMISFDQSFAAVLGIPLNFFRFLLFFLCAVTCVGAFRAVGVLLVLAFLVGPYLTARLFCHRLGPLLFYTSLIGVVASFCGVGLTRHILTVYDLPLSTAGMVVCLIGLFYFLGLGLRRIPKKGKESVFQRD